MSNETNTNIFSAFDGPQELPCPSAYCQNNPPTYNCPLCHGTGIIRTKRSTSDAKINNIIDFLETSFPDEILAWQLIKKLQAWKDSEKE